MIGDADYGEITGGRLDELSGQAASPHGPDPACIELSRAGARELVAGRAEHGLAVQNSEGRLPA